MDFLKWWWWQVLDNDTREGIVVSLSVGGLVAAVVLLVFAHMAFYPWMFCIDLFLVIAVLVWYFSWQHKTWQEREVEEEEDDV